MQLLHFCICEMSVDQMVMCFVHGLRSSQEIT